MMPKWEQKVPPQGVWAFSIEDGLFRIEDDEPSAYRRVLKVFWLDPRRLETGTVFMSGFHGPFLYPLPDPTKPFTDAKAKAP